MGSRRAGYNGALMNEQKDHTYSLPTPSSSSGTFKYPDPFLIKKNWRIFRMSTSIKVMDKDKKEFERLQSELSLRFGKEITQQELLSRIIELVKNSKEEFIHVNILPLSEEEIEKIRKLQSDWGVETTEEEIDDILYKK
jgi:biotin synthase-related radical SAM superfamily protein